MYVCIHYYQAMVVHIECSLLNRPTAFAMLYFSDWIFLALYDVASFEGGSSASRHPF